METAHTLGHICAGYFGISVVSGVFLTLFMQRVKELDKAAERIHKEAMETKQNNKKRKSA